MSVKERLELGKSSHFWCMRYSDKEALLDLIEAVEAFNNKFKMPATLHNDRNGELSKALFEAIQAVSPFSTAPEV